jgi:hypothetical protein
MNVGFIISGVLGLIIVISFAFVIQHQTGVKNLQPSLKSILLFWKEEDRAKRTNSFIYFYFIYLILVGTVCSLIRIDFDDFDFVGFILGLAIYSAPIFIYGKVAGFQNK